MNDLHREHLVVFIKNNHGDPIKKREYLKRYSDYSENEINEEVASMNTYESVLEYASPTKPYSIPYLELKDGKYRIENYTVWNVHERTQIIMETLRKYLDDTSKTLIDMNNVFRIIPNKPIETSTGIFHQNAKVRLRLKREKSTFPIIPFDFNQAFVDDIFKIESPAFASIKEFYIKKTDEPEKFPSYFFDFVDTVDPNLTKGGQNNVLALAQGKKDTPQDRLEYICDLVKANAPSIIKLINDYNYYISNLEYLDGQGSWWSDILTDEEFNSLLYNFKLAYYVDAYQYIYFTYYSSAIKTLSNSNNIILNASEKRGFYRIEKKISPNITLKIRTNFSFGNSAQFHTQLYYKNVLISLFSYLLEYAYTWEYTKNIERGYENIEYTKIHKVKRKGWKEALEFAKGVFETIQYGGEDAFVKKYIVGELNKFLRYFEKLKDSPQSLVERYFQKLVNVNGKEVHVKSNADIQSYIAEVYLNGKILPIREQSSLPDSYKGIPYVEQDVYTQILQFEDSLYQTVTAEKTTKSIDFVKKLREYDELLHIPIFKEAEYKIYDINRQFKVIYCNAVDDIKLKLRHIDEFLDILDERLELLHCGLFGGSDRTGFHEITGYYDMMAELMPLIDKAIISLFDKDERIRNCGIYESSWKTSIMLSDASPEVKNIEDSLNRMVEKYRESEELSKQLEYDIKQIEKEIAFLKDYKDVYNGFLDSLQSSIAKIDF